MVLELPVPIPNTKPAGAAALTAATFSRRPEVLIFFRWLLKNSAIAQDGTYGSGDRTGSETGMGGATGSNGMGMGYATETGGEGGSKGMGYATETGGEGGSKGMGGKGNGGSESGSKGMGGSESGSKGMGGSESGSGGKGNGGSESGGKGNGGSKSGGKGNGGSGEGGSKGYSESGALSAAMGESNLFFLLILLAAHTFEI